MGAAFVLARYDAEVSVAVLGFSLFGLATVPASALQSVGALRAGRPEGGAVVLLLAPVEILPRPPRK